MNLRQNCYIFATLESAAVIFFLFAHVLCNIRIEQYHGYGYEEQVVEYFTIELIVIKFL